MSATRVFLGLPDLQKLCCVVATLQENNNEDARSRQRITCRELVFLHSDVLACPGLDSFDHIQVVMATTFLQTGIVQLFGEQRHLQLGPPQRVSPGVLQCCLSFSLITRLAPSWNKAASYLVAGRDFLSESGRLEAVSMELSTTYGELCLSLRSTTVRLPLTTLQDFDLPPVVRSRFCRDVSSVLDPSPSGQPVWCHVLPSMKKGQIMTISRQLPPGGRFSSYRELQGHWRRLYGYQLPDLLEDDVVYCHVYFKLLGEKMFTYPLSCIRLQPVKPCQQADQQGALHSFLADVRERLQTVCGFTARLTTKPRQRRDTAAEVDPVSTSTSSNSSSSRMLLSHHHHPPSSLVPLTWSHPPPSSSSISSSFSTSSSTSFSTTSTFPSFPSSSSRMLLSHHHHPPQPLVPLSWSQPPSSSSSSSSTSSSTSPSTSSTPPKAPVPLVPKMVPLFSTAATFKQRQQVRGGGGGGGGKLVGRRVTIPLHRKQGPSSSTSSSPARPPPFVPIFGRRPKPLAAAASPTVKPLPRPTSAPPASIDPPLTPKLNFRPSKLPRPSARCGGPVEEQQASVGIPPLNVRHRPASRGVRSTPAHLDVELRVRISQEEPSQKVVSSLTQVIGTEGQMEDEEAQLEV